MIAHQGEIGPSAAQSAPSYSVVLSNGRHTRSQAGIAPVALLVATAAALLASTTVGAPEQKPEPTDPAAAALLGDDPEDEIASGQVGRLAHELTPTVAKRVERIRGLEFVRIPAPEVISGERFAELAARETPSGPRADRALADDETAARLLGLQEPGEQLDVLSTGAPDLAAAAYDTERERLYVIRDAVGTSRALLEFLLAHELDHALDDQNFGLDEGVGANDDEALAGIALIEGTATTVMIDYAAQHLNPLALSAAAVGIDPGTDEVPEFFVEQLTWAYLGGSGFVNSLLDSAGDWEQVDEAFDSRPPQSTEQILHTEAYEAGEKPLAVAANVSALESRGWQALDRGVLGEYTTGQVLEAGAPEDAAGNAAAGWGGDQYALLSRSGGGVDCERECASERILVASWRWDSAAEADEFERTLPAYLIGGREAAPAGADLWTLDGAWVASAIEGDATALAFAPSRELAGLAARAAVAG